MKDLLQVGDDVVDEGDGVEGNAECGEDGMKHDNEVGVEAEVSRPETEIPDMSPDRVFHILFRGEGEGGQIPVR